MRKKFARAMYVYQKACWYAGLALVEVRKPLTFLNETLLIITYLAVRGYVATTKEIIIAYAILYFVAVLIGKAVQKMDIVKYNTKFNNRESPELMEILGDVKEIKEYLHIPSKEMEEKMK